LNLGRVVAFGDVDATAVRAAQHTYDCRLLFQGDEVTDGASGLGAVREGMPSTIKV
jgi:hypothetical protein